MRRIPVCVACLTIVPLALANVPDWSSFRGNATQTGVATSSLPDKLEVLWKVSAKDSFDATAAIVGDTVYVGNMDAFLYAIELATGKTKWTYKATDAIQSSPAVKGGRVCFGDLAGIIHCVDAVKGTKLWTVEAEGEIISSPTWADNRILVGSGDGNLYCLEPETGKVHWKVKTDGAIQTSVPVVDGRTFVAGCDPTVHVVEIATGKELAALALNVQGQGSAAVAGDHLYLGNNNRNSVLAIDWKKGEVAWEYFGERSMPFESSPAIAGDLVIIGGEDKLVHALDRKTGESRWSFATKRKVKGSPVVVGKRVFIGSQDGSLYALNLASGAKLWEQALGAQITASPAVGQERLVIGTRDGVLYCFGAK